MLILGRSIIPVEIITIMMVDSIAIKDVDRDVIVHNCIKAKQNKILITHGTDTMVNTARYIVNKIKDKIIF